MKNNKLFSTLFAASALLLSTSCEKQELSAVYTEPAGFTAVIEQDTKTTLSSDYKVNWTSGDRININGAVYSATPKDNPTWASFTKESGEEPTAPYKAIYPAELYQDGHFEFPSVQTYKGGGGEFNAPMYAENNTKNLSFKNICGVLCFSLKGTDWIKSISVTADEPLCGAFTVQSDGKSVDLSGSGKTVTLDCYFSSRLDENNATNFYIYLPVGTYSGLKVTLTNATNDTIEKVASSEITILRSSIYTFNWELDFDSEWILLDEGTIYETPCWNEQEERPLFYHSLGNNLLECLIPSCFGKETIADGRPYDVKDYKFYWNTENNQVYIPKQYMGFTNNNGQTWFMDLAEWCNWEYFYYYYSPEQDIEEWINYGINWRSSNPNYYSPYFEGGTFYLADIYTAGEPGTDEYLGDYNFPSLSSYAGCDKFVCKQFRGFE